MRGDAQPGARQWRGVRPGHRLQGDGVSPTDQGTPGIVDGDGEKRPPMIRLVDDSLIGGHTLFSPCTSATLTERTRYFSLNCGENGDY